MSQTHTKNSFSYQQKRKQYAIDYTKQYYKKNNRMNLLKKIVYYLDKPLDLDKLRYKYYIDEFHNIYNDGLKRFDKSKGRIKI